MSTNSRHRKFPKIEFAVYISILGLLGFSAFFLNNFFVLRKPLFISPIGKINVDPASVKKILKDKNILFSRVTLSDYSYLVDIQNNGQVRFSLDKDIEKQISSLQKILRELTIEGKPFKSMDFRFEEPIVSF